MRALLLCLLAACAQPASQDSGPADPAGAATPDPAAAALHQRLFAAADAKDVAGFKALLTDDSVALLDAYFSAARTLPSEGAPQGWPEFVAHHAALSEQARAATPYPVSGGETPRLDLAAHPDAGYFREVISRLGD